MRPTRWAARSWSRASRSSTRSSQHSVREVVAPDGRLNRARLAELAFRGGRLQELNAIVHPAVIEAQRRWMDEVFARDPDGRGGHRVGADL